VNGYESTKIAHVHRNRWQNCKIAKSCQKCSRGVTFRKYKFIQSLLLLFSQNKMEVTGGLFARPHRYMIIFVVISPDKFMAAVVEENGE